MLDKYGIRCVSHDPLIPKLRPRTVLVPGRDGQYDFGAERYDERVLRLYCDSIRGLSRQALREAAAALTKKGRLVLWDEPDKHYIGRVYNQTELRYLGMAGHEFTLTFLCDPFAYGETVSGPMPEIFDYRGSAVTPVRLQIINRGETAIQGLRIRIREKKGAV